MTEQVAGLLGSSIVVPEDNMFLHNQRLGLVQVKADTAWCNEFFSTYLIQNTFEIRSIEMLLVLKLGIPHQRRCKKLRVRSIYSRDQVFLTPPPFSLPASLTASSRSTELTIHFVQAKAKGSALALYKRLPGHHRRFEDRRRPHSAARGSTFVTVARYPREAAFRLLPRTSPVRQSRRMLCACAPSPQI